MRVVLLATLLFSGKLLARKAFHRLMEYRFCIFGKHCSFFNDNIRVSSARYPDQHRDYHQYYTRQFLHLYYN